MQNLEKLAELAKAIPDEAIRANAEALVEAMGEVIEGIGDKPIEWRPSLLKLVQGTSDRSKLPRGAAVGAMVLGEKIIEQPFEVIPLRSYVGRQYWNPDQSVAQVICSSPDGTVGFNYGDCRACPYSKFDTENNKSQCNKVLTILAVARDLSSVFTINFAKTGYASGTDWQGMMKKAGVSPYKRAYVLSSGPSPKSKNVEVLKAEAAADNRLQGEILAFVEELFRISGEDRKQVLAHFKEYVERRKENALLAAPETHDEGVQLLDAPSEEPQAELVDAEPAKDLGGKAGRKYHL